MNNMLEMDPITGCVTMRTILRVGRLGSMGRSAYYVTNLDGCSVHCQAMHAAWAQNMHMPFAPRKATDPQHKARLSIKLSASLIAD